MKRAAVIAETDARRAIERVIDERIDDIRAVVDPPAFRAWLGRRLERWERDPVFQARTAIRDLQRRHPELSRLEGAYRAAVAASRGSDAGLRLTRLERECANARKAVAGLTRALDAAAAERAPAIAAKLERYRTRLDELADERRTLLASCAECRAAQEAHERLVHARTASGVDAAEARLARLLAERGRAGGRAGAAFEHEVRAIVERLIVPTVASEPSVTRILGHVRLGASRVELDHVVVEVGRDRDAPVEVLAVVEAKRNINDLAHGFELRTENITWLSGSCARIDPGRYRTRVFTAGCFDRVVEHRDGDERYRFAPSSFARFEVGAIPSRLHLVTHEGPVRGMSSGALARLANRVATDRRWNPDDDSYLARLLAWAHGLARSFESPDLLRLYASSDLASRLIIVASAYRNAVR